MKFLWFVLGCAVLIAPIPLVAWAAKGDWRDGWAALKEYSKVMGWMLAASVLLAALMGAFMLVSD